MKQKKSLFAFATGVIMMLFAGVFVSCQQDNEVLNMVKEQSDTTKVVNGINAITTLQHQWDTTSNRSHPKDDMLATLKIYKTENGKVAEEIFNHSVEPYCEVKSQFAKNDFSVTEDQLGQRPTSKKINRRLDENGGDVSFRLDTVVYYFANGQQWQIASEVSQHVVAVGPRDFYYGSLSLTGAEFASITVQPLGTKANEIVDYYLVTCKSYNYYTETNVSNPVTFKVPVEGSYICSKTTSNEIVKVEVKNKVREGISDTEERCAFDWVATLVDGSVITITKEMILYHLFGAIDPYSKDVQSFAYSLINRNGITEGTESQNRTQDNWTIFRRTDGYSSNLGNKVEVDKIVTDYSLMHERATYKDEYVEVEFGYADINITETAADTKVTEVATDRQGYRKANLVNNIATNYLKIDQPLDETVYLYMVDKGVKDYELKNDKLTVYRDSVVAVIDRVTIFNDGSKETVKEHISKPRTLAPISDWQSIQRKAEESTSKDIKVELTSQTKNEGYWSYVQEVRSLSNQTTLFDGSTKTNAWICETPNSFVYEYNGVKKEFSKIEWKVEHFADILTEAGTEGDYRLYNFTEQIKVTFGSDTQSSTAPGLLKVSTEVEKYDYKDKKLTITDTEVIPQVTFVTVYFDGRQEEEVISVTLPRSLEVISNWTATEYKPGVSTGSTSVQVLTREKKSKDDFTFYEEVRGITTKATLNNSVQTNEWKSTDPNRIVFSKNGVTVDFGTISFVATEKGQNVTKVDDKNYNYTDKIEVVFGDNTKTSTAPGKIVITSASVTGYEISNAKRTDYQDRINTSLRFTTLFSDGTSSSEDISKDFPRSFRLMTNWTSTEENNSQSTGSANVSLTGSNNLTDGDFSYTKETRRIRTTATLKGSTQNNEWESVDPNKIVFSRNGKTHDFGTITFSATEKGANVQLTSETATLATYAYTDNLSVKYGDNSFDTTAPGTIRVEKEIVPVDYEISNAKRTDYQDRINTSLRFTTIYSDGTKKNEDISKDFPRSFSVKSNWTSTEENNSQSTGSASVSLTGSSNLTDGDFSYTKETRRITTTATLKSSTQTNEWESVDPNKIVFSRNGKTHDFGTITFSATEKGATTTKKSDTQYAYTDNISVSYGSNSFDTTAPGTINIVENWVPDFPDEYGKFVSAVVTTTRDESRKTWMYIVSVQFEKKTLPLFIHQNDSKPSFDLKYAVDANSKLNSASYIKNQDTWLNTIASDGAECLDWTTLDGKNADNIPYSTAAAWGWDNGYQVNNHSTVFTKTYTATVKDSVLTIKKGNTVFATYKSAK